MEEAVAADAAAATDADPPPCAAASSSINRFFDCAVMLAIAAELADGDAAMSAAIASQASILAMIALMSDMASGC